MGKWGGWALVAGLGICTAFAIAGAAVADGLAPTATPIRYLVVIDDENISFDHYFATYPLAANPSSEPTFIALPKDARGQRHRRDDCDA
jgi:phospholipase C